MRSTTLKSMLKTATLAVAGLLLTAGASFAQQQINLTAAATSIILPDGNSVPMWGYSCGTAAAGSAATCAKLNPLATGWSPVVITIPTTATGGLSINLTNSLPAARAYLDRDRGTVGRRPRHDGHLNSQPDS